jgi:hypothetical protein
MRKNRLDDDDDESIEVLIAREKRAGRRLILLSLFLFVLVVGVASFNHMNTDNVCKQAHDLHPERH